VALQVLHKSYTECAKSARRCSNLLHMLLSGAKRHRPDDVYPISKRPCSSASQNFRAIREEGWNLKSDQDVDRAFLQEEEHVRDHETVLAPVFVHTQQFDPPQIAGGATVPVKPPGHVNHQFLWRCRGNGAQSSACDPCSSAGFAACVGVITKGIAQCAGLVSAENAAVKLCSELGRGPEWDAPLSRSISFSLATLSKWHKSVGTLKAVDHSVRLHVWLAFHFEQLMRNCG
jgi:hypothetical protein